MYLDAQKVAAALPWPALIDSLSHIFTQPVHSPVRHHHRIDLPDAPAAMMLLMPAWIEGQYLGVKQVNVFPGNNALGLPALSSNYLLSCGKTGQPLAQLEGNELTARRTAAASALASRYLSRPDASRLLMVGSGRMARYLVPAHCSVRNIKQVTVTDLSLASAQKFAEELRSTGLQADAISLDQLEQATANADIISCATLSNEPLIYGDWLQPGVHLDLVGSFTPTMREADDVAVQRCDVFVDTRAGALAESGDLIIPMSNGSLATSDILAEFTELCAGTHRGRAQLENPHRAMTLFKSVGASIEDLAAAILAYERVSAHQNS